MEIEEAIKILETHNSKCSGCDKLCDDLCRPAVGIAILAINKQKPKTPNYEADGYSDGELVYDMAYCPECNHEFEYDINDWGSNYCPECGQALDWRMEDE